MRIIFVTNNYTPYSGGVVSSINATVAELLQKNHEVFIITLNFLGNNHSSDPHYIIRLTCPIKFMYKQNHMAIPWYPKKEIKELLHTLKPDIIHVHQPFLLGKAALKAAHELNIKCIFTYHTIYEEYAHYVPLPRCISKPIIEWTVKRFCKSIDGIISPSSEIKNNLIKKNISCPISVIPSTLRPFFFDQNKKTLCKKETSFFNILLVSRFAKEKNIPSALYIIKKLPKNFTLTLVGYGTEYEFLKKLAFQDLQLSHDRVRFIYKPEQTELLSLYQKSHLFLYSSQTDTQGIVVAEAMSQGLPVLAFDGPGQRDIIKNGYNGYIASDVKHMTKIIKSLYHNPHHLNNLSHGALKTAIRYSPNTIINQLTDFYQKIITFNAIS